MHGGEAAVLVVERDPDLGRLFASILRVEGFEVTLASDAVEGRALVDQHAPQLIVFDWSLTDTAGYVWVDELRSSALTAHIPVLLVCGSSPPRSVYDMLALAGVPVIEKPFDLLQFTRHIHALLPARERQVGVL